jgi:RecA-family ATPase
MINNTLHETKKMKMVDISSMPTRDFVIKRLEIERGNLTLLCATGCSGKTMLAQYIASCVGSAKSLFGTFDVVGGSVLHIDQEQSEMQTLRRYCRLSAGLNVSEIDVARTTLKKRLDDPSLDHEETLKELVEACTGIALCIIDSLKAASVADENSSDISDVLKMLKQVAEKTNCAILVIHHKGKGKDSKQSGRGHSSIYDSVDGQFDLEMSNGVYEITCAKSRESYFDGIKYQLLDEGRYIENQACTERLEFHLLQDNVKSTKLSQEDKVIAALMEHDQLKYNDLFAIVRGDRNKLPALLLVMIDHNKIVQTIGAKGSKLYSLTEETKQEREWKINGDQ